MTHSRRALPLWLIVVGFGAIACGQASGGSPAAGSTDDADQGGAGPVLGARRNTGPLRLDVPFLIGGQGGEPELVDPPETANAPHAPARTATPPLDTTSPRIV